ncbi:MAG: ubiquinone biosynthesis protein [Microbacteriaceae bacterium]|nr:ubiquinone biosynthesis protein [Microbacteriaceae bacterium]
MAGHKLDRSLPFEHRSGPHVAGDEARAQEARKALEELGPTFVKLGQLLSTRRDLLAAAYVREFEKLQDSADPVPSEAIMLAI